MNYLDLKDLSSYTKAYNLSNDAWSIVSKWDYFARDTIGKQFVNAVDSISANLAEGFGHYHKKDKIKYYHYSFGSVKECVDWSNKSLVRKLISETEHKIISDILTELRGKYIILSNSQTSV